MASVADVTCRGVCRAAILTFVAHLCDENADKFKFVESRFIHARCACFLVRQCGVISAWHYILHHPRLAVGFQGAFDASKHLISFDKAACPWTDTHSRVSSSRRALGDTVSCRRGVSMQPRVHNQVIGRGMSCASIQNFVDGAARLRGCLHSS